MLRYLVASLLFLPMYSQGAIIITATETGGNVLFNGSGTLNVMGLTPDFGGPLPGGISPSDAGIVVGSPSLEPTNAYTGGIIFPASYGVGIMIVSPDSGFGDKFGVVAGTRLIVPENYISGSDLASSMTFVGASFVSLGLAPGSYVWTWGSGVNQDSLTLNVVPEPGSSTFVALGSTVLLRRKRA